MPASPQARLCPEAGFVEPQQDLDLALSINVHVGVIAKHAHDGRLHAAVRRRLHLEKHICDAAADLLDLHA